MTTSCTSQRGTKKPGFATRLVLTAAAMGFLAGPLHAATPEKIEEAIKKGVDALYKLQNAQGNWEINQTRPGPGVKVDTADGSQFGGKTALATYALLAAGERPLDDRIVKATEWLRTADVIGSYALGVRANVWLNLPTTPQNMAAMAKDGKALVEHVAPKNSKFAGTYNYTEKVNHYDMSCSQYGVLGMWAVAQRMESSVNPQYWLMVEEAWHKLQQPDGGWVYRGVPAANTDPSKPIEATSIQLGAAGVATLFITQDYLHSNAGLDGTQGNINDPYITKGLTFIASKLPTLIKSPNLYAMYGIERIGVASGYKYIGDVDWFQAGADALLRQQSKTGAWSQYGNEPGTSFALLFLSRGRAPVMMNKLQYDLADKEGNWNQRPRDVANVAKWVDAKIERHLNWQIIDLKHKEPLRDLHDSKILYISGNQALNFKPEEQAVLKQYIEEGGLIVATADAGKDIFAKSFRDLGKKLFPEYEFKQLDEKSAPLMTSEQFPASQWKKKMRIEALGNNARWFMILLPDADVGKTFQRQDQNRPEAYQFFANLFLYSIDKTDARFKGDTHIVRVDPKVKTTKTITVGRLKYNGRWDPEPGGWKRLAAVMNNTDKVKLEVKPLELGKDKLDGVKIVHLTGVDKFTLTASQRTALQDFVKGGGLLVIDAAGGSDDFNASVQAELSKMFPDQVAQLAAPIKKDDPLYTLGTPLTAKYRSYTLIKRPSGALGFRLNGLTFNNKLGVIYSSDDLSCGLVGQSVDGIIGYTPDVATGLMERIINLKDAGKI